MGYAWKRGRSVGQREKKKNESPHVRWKHVFSLMRELFSRVAERERERETLDTPWRGKNKLVFSKQKFDLPWTTFEGGFSPSFFFFFFLINRSEIFRFSICFHYSFVIDGRFFFPRPTFFRYKIFTVATRDGVTVTFVHQWYEYCSSEVKKEGKEGRKEGRKEEKGRGRKKEFCGMRV